MLPPSWPVACSACQMACTTGSGVSELRRRCRAAYSADVTASARSWPISAHPSRYPVAPGSGKQCWASSVAPHPTKRSSCACSSGVDERRPRPPSTGGSPRCRATRGRPTTVAIEDIVAAICDGAGFARRCSGVSIMQVRCITSEDSSGSLHARSETGVVEQRAGKLRGVWHEPFQWRATAGAEFRSVRRHAHRARSGGALARPCPAHRRQIAWWGAAIAPRRIGLHSCCWPNGEPGTPAFLLCDDPALIDVP